MDEKELNKLIRIGEGYTTEFKTSPSHIAREICAFANASGGRILIGVDDQGRKVEVKDLNRTISEIQTSARNIDPPVVLDIENVEDVLVVGIPSGPNKPYSANGLFYIREAANTQQMKRDQIRDFFFREGLIRFDEQPCRKFDMRRDFDAGKYQAFVKVSGIPATLRKEDVLKNLRIVTEEGMTNAGALLFSKHVPKFFLQASLSCALFQGTSKTKILDHVVIEGSVQENYDAAISYLKSHLNTEYVIKGGPREEILELPEEALREALLNAVGHRDYRSTSNIQVNIYRDRVEIWNPGGLVSGLRLQDLGHVSRPRNLLLFSLMARMNLVEHIGSGVKRIREALKGYGLKPPLIQADGAWFSMTFVRKGPHDAVEALRGKGKVSIPSRGDGIEGVNGAVSEGVNGGINALLEFIRQAPGLRKPQISKAMGISEKTLEHWLRELRDQDKIEFRGSPKTGGYRRRDQEVEGVNGGVSEGVSGGVNALLEFIRKTPGLRKPQLSKATGIPVKTLEKHLKKLKNKGVIEFRGSPKTGGYYGKGLKDGAVNGGVNGTVMA
ncbi:MAG: ATP-binding protein [Thermodesulfobacteriota bacterium]